MKPHTICHMVCSVDGRTLHDRWRPKSYEVGDLFEQLHDKIGCDASIAGRVTGQEFAMGEGYDQSSTATFPREPWFATREADAFGIILDDGKIAWGRSDIGGDPLIVVLSTAVPDWHLAGLRADRVSYIFAGSRDVDLSVALETLNRELGIKRLLVEGGGTTNGEFLRAGLLDELSVAICPAVDGGDGAPSIFHSNPATSDVRAQVRSMTLESSEVLDGGEIWLRYWLDHLR